MSLANPWFKLGLDAWSLGVESSTVISLRAIKIATGGPTADAEVRQMVSEKVDALFALQTMAVTGRLGITPHRVAAGAVAHYRRKVRANRRRLTRIS